jgi:hypothetical protein
MKTKTICLLLCAFMVFAGCKKDENSTPSGTTPTAKTKLELLTNGSSKDWKIVSSLFNGNESLQGCEKDNTYTFHADGKYILDYGTDKCNGNENSIANNTWEFKNNETEIQWVTTIGTFDLQLIELTETILKVKQETSVGGMTTVFELTFEPK